MKKVLLLFIVLFGTILFSACDKTEEEVDIYTSIYPLEFIVREIVQDKYVVKSVYPRGKDVHSYDASPQAIMSMSKSKLIFYIGLGLEKIIEDVKDSALANVPTIPVSTNITLLESNSDHLHDHDENDDHTGIFYDPHIWLDPSRMMTITDTILENLLLYLELDDLTVNEFCEKAEDLKDRLTALDNEFRESLNRDEISSKTIMIDHDAYAYWEDCYGVKRIRMRNDNDSADVTPAQMQEKIQLAKNLNIKYVCTTKNESESAIIKTYLDAMGLTESAKQQLHNLSTITTDEEKAGYNYFSIMRQNLIVLNVVLPRKSNN
ncbi:MAG: zinc ABC transporter solute-binding protein [Acholeplasmataceae bacterium]|jgi:zinc transport system substrate-binding protein|nr:zinc ABC transporter solute-binding protein [Acholeplasmataceae bacterium]